MWNSNRLRRNCYVSEIVGNTKTIIIKSCSYFQRDWCFVFNYLLIGNTNNNNLKTIWLSQFKASFKAHPGSGVLTRFGGSRCLLGRRLAVAGVVFVQVVHALVEAALEHGAIAAGTAGERLLHAAPVAAQLRRQRPWGTMKNSCIMAYMPMKNIHDKKR